MNHHELTAAIDGAVIHLVWLNADRYTGALRLVAQVSVDLEEITASGGGDIETRDRRAIGGHSDPTGDAVAASADRQARLADRAEVICDTARWLRAAVAGRTLTAAPGTLTAAQADLEWCLTVPHAIGAWVAPSDEARRELHHAAGLVFTEAGALQCEVEQALRYSATVAAGRPKPKPRQSCRSCARFGIDENIDRANRCRRCGDFWRTHGCLPTEAICRAWHSGINRITPSMILEAKAAGRPRRKRSA